MGVPVRLDPYLDDAVPGVSDWKDEHRSHLEKARALIMICTPGSFIEEGPDDWVHKEIDWWVSERNAAPILIDPLDQGARYVPKQIHEKWPNIQRIAFEGDSWNDLSEEERSATADKLSEKIVGAILPTGAEVYKEELEQQRRIARQLRYALIAAIGGLVAALGLGGFATVSAMRSAAAQLDASAAQKFALVRLLDSREGALRDRRLTLKAAIADAPPDSPRQHNLSYELAQVNKDIEALKTEKDAALLAGREFLNEADRKWMQMHPLGLSLAARAGERPKPPFVFTIELLNAGSGESVMIHYGAPGSVRHVMISTGSHHNIAIKQLTDRVSRIGDFAYDGGPVPVELFIASEWDVGIANSINDILQQTLAAESASDRLVDITGVWANIFDARRPENNRPNRIVGMLQSLLLPLNKPFAQYVMRPNDDAVSITISGGLKIGVLNPVRDNVATIHDNTLQDQLRHGPKPIDAYFDLFQRQTFTNSEIEKGIRFPSTSKEAAVLDGANCKLSENAVREAKNLRGETPVRLSEQLNLVLLFQFAGKSFLYTGYTPGRTVIDRLETLGLIADGKVAVDLLSIPNLGSDENISPDFFRLISAEHYLFSGDGVENNPAIATIASLVAARQCEVYTMYFVNRDGSQAEMMPTRIPLASTSAGTFAEDIALEFPDTPMHGDRLDAFFAAEEAFSPNYRRVFRSIGSESLLIDLGDPFRY